MLGTSYVAFGYVRHYDNKRCKLQPYCRKLNTQQFVYRCFVFILHKNVVIEIKPHCYRYKMPKQQGTRESNSSILPYVFGAAFGAVAAGIGYYLGNTNRESSTQQTAHSHRNSSSGNNPTYRDDDVDCAICFQNYEPTRILPCNHKFHEACVNEWLGIKPVCPKCNRGVS
ncbi:hypothetical protein FQA39_LY00388 [Lamprigera yunnana]|nr:hypothetical protein FQA39_LY00388 [Lamprigera yunnana]